jgi:hypothetical protein
MSNALSTLNALIAAFLILSMVASVVARVLLVFGTLPALRARVWPWLRSRPWWPLPGERRAEALLRELLTEPEYRQICATGYLDIVSPARTGRVYRVPRGPGHVLVVDHGRVSEHLCVQPMGGGLPKADVVLMHKLLIQVDEETYLHTVNHFPRLAG